MPTGTYDRSKAKPRGTGTKARAATKRKALTPADHYRFTARLAVDRGEIVELRSAIIAALDDLHERASRMREEWNGKKIK